jgi:dihydropteroate synthase
VNTALESEADFRYQPRILEPDFVLEELGVIEFDESYRYAASKKFQHLCIKLSEVSAPAANILKQTCLSLGSDAGVYKYAINCKVERGGVIISATQQQLEKLIQKLKAQPFGLKTIADSLHRLKQRQKKLQQDTDYTVLGILNATPDSFSATSTEHASLEVLLNQAQAMVAAGVSILDVGGESTRPGALAVDPLVEIQRVLPLIQLLRNHFPQIPVSIDTRKAVVARAACQAGASIINDVSGLQFEPEAMLQVLQETNARYILMHSQGVPETMQNDPQYANMMDDISAFFYRQLALLGQASIAPERIILDPGFGFAKTREQNMLLLRRLSEIVSLGFPVMVGLSRKSFLGQEVTEREALTSASHALAYQAGARWFRVHDVGLHQPVLELTQNCFKTRSIEH